MVISGMDKYAKRKRLEGLAKAGDDAAEAIGDALLSIRLGRELVKKILTLSDCEEIGAGRLAQMKTAARRFVENDLYPESYAEH